MSADLPPCKCGHASNWHRLDDSKNVSPVDPAAEFRCLGSGFTGDCGCPDYRPNRANPGGRT